MKKITCEVCDNSYDVKAPIIWQHINEDNAIDSYRCEKHFREEDFEDKEYSKGWERIV